MLRREQGLEPFDPEIDRTLRQVRRLFEQETRGLCDIVGGEEETSSSSSETLAQEGMGDEDEERLFRHFARCI